MKNMMEYGIVTFYEIWVENVDLTALQRSVHFFVSPDISKKMY